eukprot:5216331-Pyramimonas_sp.AAC.1
MVNERGFYTHPPARHDQVRAEVKARAQRAAMARIVEDSWTLRAKVAEDGGKRVLAGRRWRTSGRR